MANDQQQRQPQQPQKSNPPSAPPQASNVPPKSFLERQEEFLTSHGWEKMGENERGNSVWKDPKGSREAGKATTEVKLPSVDGTMSTIRQVTGPCLPWDYGVDEAVQVQKERNISAGTNPEQSPLEKLDKLTVAHNLLVRRYEALAKVVEDLVREPRTTDINVFRVKIRDEVSKAKQLAAG